MIRDYDGDDSFGKTEVSKEISEFITKALDPAQMVNSAEDQKLVSHECSVEGSMMIEAGKECDWCGKHIDQDPEQVEAPGFYYWKFSSPVTVTEGDTLNVAITIQKTMAGTGLILTTDEFIQELKDVSDQIDDLTDELGDTTEELFGAIEELDEAHIQLGEAYCAIDDLIDALSSCKDKIAEDTWAIIIQPLIEQYKDLDNQNLHDSSRG
jgi:hypothetical protein